MNGPKLLKFLTEFGWKFIMWIMVSELLFELGNMGHWQFIGWLSLGGALSVFSSWEGEE